MRPGLYEQLLTVALRRELDSFADPRLYSLANVDAEEAHAAIAQLLEHMLAQALARYRGAEAAIRQQRLVDRLVSALRDELDEEAMDCIRLVTPLQRLLAIYAQTEHPDLERPDTPLASSALLTGTRLDPSLGIQLRKEIAAADRVDILCSFIKWSGLRILIEELRGLTDRGTDDSLRIRVLTTSYMGATDPRAIEELSALPGTEIRVSYDTKRTRLHAKAYLIHRATGFGTAYIGSANLSHAALSEGLEWTTKVSQYELPHLWSKVANTFETYWQDDEFQRFDRLAPERLRLAIQSERQSGVDAAFIPAVDLRPYPFQEEILDILAAEREVQGKSRHLVVAATGTGKTLVAAFDYARVYRETGKYPTLLFVAHREEILRQSLGCYRAVLRDQNFGDLLVGDEQPSTLKQLFCSIQSFNSRNLSRLPADHFDYVVVDEFHHAAAPSYQRLLEHVRPNILLGLTATPERTDQLDVLQWFGGRASAEIRLPDAIQRRLLCPFQYFGVTDSVDLSGLTWQRGGYRVDDLDRVYTGNDVRARLVIEKLQEIVLHPRDCRGLGFCASIAHAEFMSRYFNDSGIPALALSGKSDSELRRSALHALRSRTVNFVFVVDLYNEGVDLPEIDTVLFLRPTESLTVFLQQLGRGLRLHDDKECLTVIDFIGAQRREFRFAARFRALSTNPTGKIEQQIEHGFPYLPSGCVIRLERIAQQRVLNNVRESMRLVRPRMVGQLRELGRYLGRPPSLQEGLEFLDAPLEDVLRRATWSQLLSEAGLKALCSETMPERAVRGLLRVSHVDCAEQIRFWIRWLGDDKGNESPVELQWLEMLLVSFWGDDWKDRSFESACRQLRSQPDLVTDLMEILEYRLASAPAQLRRRYPQSGPLTVHARYSRDEILVGLNHWEWNRRPDMREGVLHLPESKVDAFFVTLQKSEAEYSPSTMYEDVLLSHELFHWQSQSNTSVESPTGQRYIQHRSLGYTPLLFVRERKSNHSGMAAPYYFMGPADYVSHEGSRPISIVWRLQNPVPARLFRVMARHNVG
jgi:superfamily II DNA or RNA helicase